MKKRVGNDVKMTWTILRSGQAEIFDNATNIKIYAYQINSSTSNIEVDYVRNSNVFSINIPADNLNVGTYDLRLTYNKSDADIEGGVGSYAIDEHEAFQIVKHTEAEDAAGTDITGEVIYYHDSFVYIASASSALGADFTYPANISQDYLAILNSTTEIPEPSVTDFEGLWFSKIDAYRAAQIGGYTGTEEQFFLELASVQGLPEIIEDAIAATTAANDAAALAVQKAGLANEAATLANQKATLANEAATLANTKANLADEKAGLADQKATEANNAANSANGAAMAANQATNNAIEATESISETEQTVQANEALRVEAEGDATKGRVKAENDRVTAEVLRQQQETARVQAEIDRNVASNVYNVTLAVPLTAGSYYTSTTARAAVPSGVRKRGLELVYETSAGVWYCERFIGASVTTWTTSTDWEVVPTKKYVDDADALKINKSDIANNLTTTDAGKVLDARQGKILNDNVSSIFDVIGWYGVSWDTAVSTTPMTRTGNAQMHRTLPIQSKMRGCLVSDSGTVTYLPATWSDATLDGSAGQVMVEIPQHYRYFPPANGTIMECRISEYPLPNFTLVPKSYISAYEATVARSTNRLSSVVNATAEYRGGGNSATNDANPNTLLGKPATVLSRAQFRTYARNRGAGWEMLDYKTYNTLFWLYFVEYANTNSQLAVNSALDGNGYKQGGLGNGVTDIIGADWNTFNGYFPIVNCGASNSLGNGSGEVSYTVPFTVPVTTKVNRYRGIENPFGHIWKNCDGVIFDVKTDADGGTSNIYICSTPSNYSDTVTGNYTLIGQIPRTDGYIKALQSGSFLPLEIGGGSTTYWCDYFYQSIASSSLRTLFLGGGAVDSASAGLGYSAADNSVTAANSTVGSRLCFFPQ